MPSDTTSILPDNGEGESLEGLYRRYRAIVLAYVARTFGGGPPDPEDVVQAAFEKYAALGSGARIENPRAFLMRSAHNYVIDERRRRAVRKSHLSMSAGEPRDDLDAERVLSAKERWDILERAIRVMDRKRQEVLIMNRIHGLSCAEIARRKNYSATMVKRLLADALLTCEHALREADGQ